MFTLPAMHPSRNHDRENAIPSLVKGAKDWRDWRAQLENSVEDLAALVQAGYINAASAADCAAVLERYPMRVTPYYLALIEKGNASDPIAAQCLPNPLELADDCEPDPFCEQLTTPIPSLVRRYKDRILLHATARCAVRCRHCTRKNTLWRTAVPEPPLMVRIVEYLDANPDIREVIVSGGDPLLLETAELDKLLSALRAARHVKVLRLGTRVPVVLPMRVDRELCVMLRRHGPLWVNTHFNHPRELTEDAVAACAHLSDAGLPISNQTVLLRGVNDDAETLRRLSYGLQEAGVRPYYLFHCDPVRGTRHFRTPISTGMRIADQLRATLSGLCVPHYVIDLPGATAKLPLDAGRVVTTADGLTRVRDFDGRLIECSDAILPFPFLSNSGTNRVSSDGRAVVPGLRSTG